MRETWYVLENGLAVPPSEVKTGKGEQLVHKSGLAVARRGAVPSTRNVDPDEERAKRRTRDVVAEKPTGGYKTRGG